MTEDVISSLALDLHDFLEQLGRVPNENEDYDALSNLLHNRLSQFITRERNYN